MVALANSIIIAFFIPFVVNNSFTIKLRPNDVRHGGGQERLNVDEVEIAAPMQEDELLAVNEALDRFSQHAPQKAELVKLRYFAGMGLKEAGQVLGISEPTAVRWWTYSKTWLHQAIQETRGPSEG